MAQTKVLDPTGYAHAGSKIVAEILAQVSDVGASEAANVAALTDNSGGTSGGNTVAVIAAATTDTSAAKLTSTQNAFATLSAKVNAILTALEAAGIMASS